MDALLRRPRTDSVYQAHKRNRLTFAEKRLADALSNLAFGTLEVRYPSGAKTIFTGRTRPQNDQLRADIHLRRWRAIRRILRFGALGLAETFVDGDWSSENLTGLLRLLEINERYLKAARHQGPLARLLQRSSQWANRNSRRGSRRNIAYHYDLGNDFYALWLDESMTYSSALFESERQSLAAAQHNKYRRLASATGIRAGDHVLEIGCGWGGFALFAAEELGCRVTGVTLSKAQLDFAQARIAQAGLSHRVDLHLMDYRDLTGRFDHIVSIEMLEAVGIDYWREYFVQLARLLKPGGNAGIQVITIDDARFDDYRRSVDFIQKYIFPGGLLPSDAQLKRQFEKAGLVCVDDMRFGDDYRRTLSEWESAFNANIGRVSSLGYDKRFIRTWRFYLAYCQAGFAQGSIDVAQYVLHVPKP